MLSPAGRLPPLLGPPGHGGVGVLQPQGTVRAGWRGPQDSAPGAAAMIAILPELQRRAGEDHTQGRASRVTCDALTGTLDCALGRIGICAYQTDGQERVSADGADCETAA